jgi:hypothetical protein
MQETRRIDWVVEMELCLHNEMRRGPSPQFQFGESEWPELQSRAAQCHATRAAPCRRVPAELRDTTSGFYQVRPPPQPCGCFLEDVASECLPSRQREEEIQYLDTICNAALVQGVEAGQLLFRRGNNQLSAHLKGGGGGVARYGANVNIEESGDWPPIMRAGPFQARHHVFADAGWGVQENFPRPCNRRNLHQNIDVRGQMLLVCVGASVRE